MASNPWRILYCGEKSVSSLIKEYKPEEYNEAPEDDYRKRIFNPDIMEEIEDF